MNKLAQLKANTNNNEESYEDDLLPTSNNIEEIASESGAFKWPNEAILLLIEEFRRRADDFCSGKVSQKKTWLFVKKRIFCHLTPVSKQIFRPKKNIKIY